MTKSLIIYIIDDDDIYQFTAMRIIETHQLAKKTFVFSDGEMAIKYLINNVGNKDNLPDIIFLDINMPIMDGWQFLEEYKLLKPKIEKKIQIYLVSSSLNKIDLNRAKDISEISDYIIKPVKSEKLIELIEDLEKKTGNI